MLAHLRATFDSPNTIQTLRPDKFKDRIVTSCRTVEFLSVVGMVIGCAGLGQVKLGLRSSPLRIQV
jgi:hypothetical protein